ncbi:hypothetical protein AMAG_10444 [Allomyces macrogynus ATCC 38327]|uniref:Uncharacterized protein n=1 Tax=Allomyces macrogynus (strain ATCC 38327) TaxID=578462 RepID=A0A0L0SUD2_ALLM3|nr:hypothetical protein AMAG_10444 [Allomyces macrogynus ATCC 38327]|eukprot:KNE66203.1 hypothetical protein AMAG_10444 [Allomyces macrogynus ATCC 38327]
MPPKLSPRNKAKRGTGRKAPGPAPALSRAAATTTTTTTTTATNPAPGPAPANGTSPPAGGTVLPPETAQAWATLISGWSAATRAATVLQQQGMMGLPPSLQGPVAEFAKGGPPIGIPVATTAKTAVPAATSAAPTVAKAAPVPTAAAPAAKATTVAPSATPASAPTPAPALAAAPGSTTTMLSQLLAAPPAAALTMAGNAAAPNPDDFLKHMVNMIADSQGGAIMETLLQNRPLGVDTRSASSPTTSSTGDAPGTAAATADDSDADAPSATDAAHVAASALLSGGGKPSGKESTKRRRAPVFGPLLKSPGANLHAPTKPGGAPAAAGAASSHLSRTPDFESFHRAMAITMTSPLSVLMNGRGELDPMLITLTQAETTTAAAGKAGDGEKKVMGEAEKKVVAAGANEIDLEVLAKRLDADPARLAQELPVVKAYGPAIRAYVQALLKIPIDLEVLAGITDKRILDVCLGFQRKFSALHYMTKELEHKVVYLERQCLAMRKEKELLLQEMKSPALKDWSDKLQAYGIDASKIGVSTLVPKERPPSVHAAVAAAAAAGQPDMQKDAAEVGAATSESRTADGPDPADTATDASGPAPSDFAEPDPPAAAPADASATAASDPPPPPVPAPAVPPPTRDELEEILDLSSELGLDGRLTVHRGAKFKARSPSPKPRSQSPKPRSRLRSPSKPNTRSSSPVKPNAACPVDNGDPRAESPPNKGIDTGSGEAKAPVVPGGADDAAEPADVNAVIEPESETAVEPIVVDMVESQESVSLPTTDAMLQAFVDKLAGPVEGPVDFLAETLPTNDVDLRSLVSADGCESDDTEILEQAEPHLSTPNFDADTAAAPPVECDDVIAALKVALAPTADVIAAAVGETTQVRAELDKIKKQVAAFREEYDCREKHFQSLTRTQNLELQLFKAKLDQTQVQLKKEQVKSSALVAQIELFKQTEAELRSAMTDAMEELHKVTGVLTRTNNELEAHQARLHQLDKENAALRLKNDRLASLQPKLDRLASSVRTLVADRATLRARAANAEAHSQRLQAVVRAMQAMLLQLEEVARKSAVAVATAMETMADRAGEIGDLAEDTLTGAAAGGAVAETASKGGVSSAGVSASSSSGASGSETDGGEVEGDDARGGSGLQFNDDDVEELLREIDASAKPSTGAGPSQQSPNVGKSLVAGSGSGSGSGKRTKKK